MLRRVSLSLGLTACVLIGAAPGLPADPTDQAKVVSEATAGHLQALTGKLFDEGCGTEVDHQADVVDLNGDGQPEVFT